MIPIYEFDNLTPERILNRKIQEEENVSIAVDAVIAAVRKDGDAALRAYTKRFDGVELGDLRVLTEFMPISARFISNRASYQFKRKEIDRLLEKLTEVTRA